MHDIITVRQIFFYGSIFCVDMRLEASSSFGLHFERTMLEFSAHYLCLTKTVISRLLVVFKLLLMKLAV